MPETRSYLQTHMDEHREALNAAFASGSADEIRAVLVRIASPFREGAR